MPAFTFPALLDAFREDHAVLGRGFSQLADRLRGDDVAAACAIARQIDEEAGSHIAFEEESFYPRLAGLLGSEEVDHLYDEHDVGLETVRTLVRHDPGQRLDAAARVRLLEGADEMSDHISECGALFGALVEVPADEQAQLLEQLLEWRRRRPRWTDYAAGTDGADRADRRQ